MAKMTQWTLRYGVAAVAVATAIVFLLIPEIGKGLASIVFLAVLIAAWYGGLGPGLLATGLIAAVAIVNLVFGPDYTHGAGDLDRPVRGWRGADNLAGRSPARLTPAGSKPASGWLTAVLNSIGDAVIATDEQGRVTFLNPVARSLTGWDSNEAVGESLTDVFRIVTEDTHEPIENPVDRVLRDDVVVGLSNHTILIAKDGMERPIDDSGAPIKEKGGATTGVVLVFRDIAERKRLEHELRRRLEDLAEAGRRKDEFLAMLAHELRNPLAAISTAAQLSTMSTTQDQIAWSMDVINRQIKQLARLIDDLFDVSRITRGRSGFAKSPGRCRGHPERRRIGAAAPGGAAAPAHDFSRRGKLARRSRPATT